MEADCAAHVQRCHQCQVHGDMKHMPPIPLHSMTSPWPFSTWGINIIGKIHPTTSNGHEFILVAIDYFTKWIEAASHKVLNSKKVAQFILTNIIYRYGYRMKLSLTIGSISREKQKSCYDNSTFNTTSPHLIVLRLMEQLRLLIKTLGESWRRAQGTTRTGTYSCPMHSRGIEHQSDLPQESLLIH